MLQAKHNYAHGYGYLDPQGVAAYTQPQAPGSGDLQQTLQKLADLRDQGLLSQAEFDAKKRELLSRI
jgi:predicted Zn-dependent peptidase